MQVPVMHFMRIFIAAVLAALVAACGGGGGSAGQTPGGSTANTQPTVALQLINSAGVTTATISDRDTFSLRATVRDASGNLLAGQVVTFKDLASLVKFNPSVGTALTDANGVAVVQVSPLLATSAGAGTVTADLTVNGVAAVQGTLNYQVVQSTPAGDPTLRVAMRDVSNASTNVVSRSGVTYGRAVLLDGSGRPIVGTIVTFSADAALVTLSPAGGRVLTNSDGVATVEIRTASASSAGAGTLSASATAGESSLATTFDFQVASGSGPGIPTVQLQLRDSAGVSTNIVGLTGVTTARATVQDAGGAPVPGKIVTFSADAKLVTINPASGTALTDANGVATVQLSRASLAAAGAGTLSVSASVADAVLTTTFDYQLAAAAFALQGLDLGSGGLPAYGNRAVSVIATLNGQPSTGLPVQVTFSASCGSVTPSTVTTDSSGRAVTTYKADSSACSGTSVTITASATGASNVSGAVSVQSAQATNIQFVDVTPNLIYLRDSIGPTQSLVRFRIVDATGAALANQSVQLSLLNAAPGVSLGTVGNSAIITRTSDGAGLVAVPVFSGTVPTSLQVRAALTANGNVRADSNILTVASGIPAQRAISVSLSKFSIEGMSIDGETSRITVSLADRVGNPVPVGTPVNFVSSSGVMIPPQCVVTGSSSCSVEIRSQGTRIPNGRVAILAYTPGEEDFVDANGNNVYDSGEAFTDLGNAHLDADFSGSYDGGEFTVPRTGAVACTPGLNGRPGTCDGVWGGIDVRAQAMVVFASSVPVFSVPVYTGASFSISVADVNGNSMPTGTSVALQVINSDVPDTDSVVCTLVSSSTVSIANVIGPTRVTASVSGCKSATGDRISITTTSPSGVKSAPYIYTF
jgi:Bacterial Ig-like domain (group 1)